MPVVVGQMGVAAGAGEVSVPPPLSPHPQEPEDSIDSSTFLVAPDTPTERIGPGGGQDTPDCSSAPSLSTVV